MFESEPANGHRRVGRLAHVAVLIGVIAIAAGAAFAYKSMSEEKGGGDTPEAAAQRFFDALGNEDVLGILEVLPPSERDALTGSIVDIARELSRLHVLSDDVDLSGISGLDLSFEGLRFASTRLSDRLAIVRIVAGRGRMAIHPRQLPLGSFVRDLAGSSLDEEPTPEIENLANEDAEAAAVREGGQWYISFAYSAAEAAREEAGAPLPRADQRINARGAATPEAAVEELVHALGRFDIRRAIELMPPDEARALHDYAGLFIDQAEKIAADARSSYRVDITHLKLSSVRSNDEARVKVEDLQFDADATDESFSVTYDGKCARVRGRDVDPAFAGDTLCTTGQLPALFFGLRVPKFAEHEPALTFVVTQREGAWYVSPTRTVLQGFAEILRGLQLRDLEALRDFFRGI
jgi:hypothetical protein